MILIIDASSNTSGGGKIYLKKILELFNPKIHAFNKVYVYCPKKISSALPKSKYVVYKSNFFIERGFFGKMIWNIFLKNFYYKASSGILFSPYGNYFGSFKPFVSMSQNMLLYEQKERKRFGMNVIRLKLFISSIIQNFSIRKSNGVIFLSQYARTLITNNLNIHSKNSKIIHFGIDQTFFKRSKPQNPIKKYTLNNPFKLLYVSTVFPYKHHENVVKAVGKLKSKGYPISLSLVGGGDKKLINRLKKTILKQDPESSYINFVGNVCHKEIIKYYHNSDAFIFASSCENMPNILMEAMKSALPIASSFYGPMKEFLGENAFYFDPLKVIEITNSLEELILSENKRSIYIEKNQENINRYTWESCANKTFNYLYSFKDNNKI